MYKILIDQQSFSLASRELFLVGRGEKCDIRLNDPSASRVHCRLLARDGTVFLTDAGSRWGTFVNGVRVSECELIPGDEITIGETLLRLDITMVSQGTTLARRSEIARPSGLSIAAQQALPVANLNTARGLSPPSKYLFTEFAGTNIEELLCRTKTGLLFRGNRSGKSVAVKLLHPESLPTETDQTRFLRAVDLTRQLKHKFLVELIDGGILDGIPYAISEFIPGENAAQMIRRIGIAGMLDWRTTLRISIDMALVLEYLESKKVLHRNVTPQHILVRAADGHACLNDLLIAKALDDSQPMLTQPGEVLGEIAFASPEQLGSGQPVDHRSDIYQLGATLYALLTGRPPFEGPSVSVILDQVLHAMPTPPTRYHLSIPPLFEGTINTMLAKRPHDRFASGSALLRALERVLQYVG